MGSIQEPYRLQRANVSPSLFEPQPVLHNRFQRFVQFGRKYFPHGWDAVLRTAARHYPDATLYQAKMRHGDILFLDLSEAACYGYFYDGELIYELFTADFVRKYLRKGDICLDVGANVGYLTRMMGKIVGRFGAVHAYEPNPAAFRLLQANTHDLPQATLHPQALSDRPGMVTFSLTSKGTLAMQAEPHDVQRTMDVPAVTLDQTTAHMRRIDFVKVDVQGAELAVLRGGMQMIEQHRPLIYFQFLDAAGAARAVPIQQYEALLQPLGYTLRWVSPNYPLNQAATAEPAYYVVALPDVERWHSLASREAA